ncbi:substrate-binding domain-containing protein [Telmatospirillum sp.]|uniref:LacI family DNA-binding transcriptional regulator n=1 Tax=Telmatospirillum sp. TaxID=2079197 RepID=UPI00283E1FC0|nr:substrate-binding domain-containing protein [Telmatospirillum sp.]MDR3435667.1 substrate-binding domain-containing protein [Telmatospirillum sp.]
MRPEKMRIRVDRLSPDGEKAPRVPRAQDVAAAAGISTATVSRTFNSPEKVAPAVRKRVLAAAASLGWLPHAAGAALANGRTAIVGVVIPTLGQEVFAVQVEAMQAAFAERGITLLIGCSNYNPAAAQAQVRAMLARGVEALAIVGETQEPGLFEMIQARRIPYVVTYGYQPDSPHPCVGFDNHEAFRTITRHLLALGHQTFGLILQPKANNDRVAARLDGVRQALAEQGLGLRPQHLCEGHWEIGFGRKSLRAMFEGPRPHPTAVICGTDLLAIGALLEARAMGLTVPRDLSITGFDDIAFAAEIDPPLTTMRVDNAEIGRLAAQHLLALLDGNVPASKVAVTAQFVERATTAAPSSNHLSPRL